MTFNSGINKNVRLNFFSDDERKIIEYLSCRDWFVTLTKTISIANSSYKALLMKPSDSVKNAFNINREIVVAFSPYETFEPRSLDAIEHFDVQELRLEEICSLIISKDENVSDKVSSIVKNNKESRVIISLSYAEILNNLHDPEFLINKFRKGFYSRDLFGIQDSLKKDTYFFGRGDLIQTLVNRHLESENSGVFGLRKTGKTSILFKLERALDRKTSMSLYIDCMTLHNKSWNTALFYIIQELAKKGTVKRNELKNLDDYKNSEFASDYFIEDIEIIYRKIGKKSILLIFDKVENITFDTSISEGWKNGKDFIKFWQAVRSASQKLRTANVFTYLISGTNPRCIEKPTIEKVDNPIFSQIPPIYIPAFDFTQTKEMLDKLGGFMGLLFDESVCSRLVEDFGGHPLLMRQMCSFLHKKVTSVRPFKINKTFYEKEKENFFSDEQGFIQYARLVLEVLENWYSEEFEMLKYLALGDYVSFCK